MSDEIPEREIALAKSRFIEKTYGLKSSKIINDEIEKLIKENRKARRKIKKIEFQFWKPKLTIEWEFPFKK